MGKTGLLRRVLLVTAPVMCGYLFMGAAFGILLSQAGYHFGWALLMSVMIYAGTMQYMAVPFLVAQTDLFTVALTTLLVHFRHFVYGLSFIERFRPMGWRKFYMMFGMTDETYALLCGAQTPEHTSEEKYMFYIALLNQCYWIIGCVFGTVAGAQITFNTKGIDFAMTALFIVICADQWRVARSKLPVFIGGSAAVLSLLIFQASNMLIPAILMIMVSLLLLRKQLEPILLEEKDRP